MKKGKKTDWVNYRQLEKGEIVKEGDDFFDDNSKRWIPALHGVGRATPDPQYTAHTRYRRLIKQQKL